MKTFLRSSLVILALTVALASTVSARVSGGHVDFSSFLPAKSGQVVEITVGSMLLKFAAMAASVQEPEAAKLLRNIQLVQVNVVELDESNCDDAATKLTDVNKHLEAKGWVQSVKVHDSKSGQMVNVYIKSRDAETIEGVVVTVIDRNREAVFVNVVGNIKASQVAELCNRFDIHGLDGIDLERS